MLPDVFDLAWYHMEGLIFLMRAGQGNWIQLVNNSSERSARDSGLNACLVRPLSVLHSVVVDWSALLAVWLGGS